MPDSTTNVLRPKIVTLRHKRYQVQIIDAEQILTTASRRRVDMLRDPKLPAPLQLLEFSIDRASETRMDALIHISRDGRARTPTTDAPGRDALNNLLSRHAEAGEPWTNRVIDGVTAVADQMTRRLGLGGLIDDFEPDLGEAVETTERVDEATGLRAEIVSREPNSGSGPSILTLHAVAPEQNVTVDHLLGMCRLLVDVLVDRAGDAPGQLTLSVDAHDESTVSLDQVGGLDDIVGQLREIAVSFRHPQTMARWGARRPQGLLFYGPAGTGKTMLARALAHEIGARFQEIHTPDILDKWLGASERNIKRIFRDARNYREPTVMLFDEFDAVIGYAGDGTDSASHAINSVAGIFKQEMNDLVEGNPQVIVVATTNFPGRIDPSLVRSGRFDVKVLVPAPRQAARAQILTKMIRQLIAAHEKPGFRMFADDLDIDDLGARAHGLTGADLREALRRTQLSKALEEARTATPASPISHNDLGREIDRMTAAPKPAM